MPEARLQRTRQAYEPTIADVELRLVLQMNRLQAKYDTDYRALPKMPIGETITMRLPPLADQRASEVRVDADEHVRDVFWHHQPFTGEEPV